jgi:hypothetical protein
MLQDVCIFAGTKTLRRVDFRIDRCGVYLNFYQEGFLVAGLSFQFPAWMTRSYYIKPGISAFSWDFEQVHARETAIKVEKLPDGTYLTYNPYHIWTFDLHYSAEGDYLGQYQDDAYDGGRLYCSAEMIDGNPCVNGKPMAPLSAELRASAEPTSPKWYGKDKYDDVF